MPLTLDEAVAARDDASRRLHWYLLRAASYVMHDCALGPPFDRDMALAERARQDWHDAQAAILSAGAAHGR